MISQSQHSLPAKSAVEKSIVSKGARRRCSRAPNPNVFAKLEFFNHSSTFLVTHKAKPYRYNASRFPRALDFVKVSRLADVSFPTCAHDTFFTLLFFSIIRVLAL
jgi:hypothetical protein